MTRITGRLPGPSLTARQRGTLIVSCRAVGIRAGVVSVGALIGLLGSGLVREKSQPGD